MLKYTEPVEAVFEDSVMIDGNKYDLCEEITECCIARIKEADKEWVLYKVTDCRNGNITVKHGEDKHYLSVNWFLQKGNLKFVLGPESIKKREEQCIDYRFAKPILDGLREKECIFDITRWRTYSDPFKVLLLCYVMARRNAIVLEQSEQFDTVCEYEKKRSDKFIYALLLYLCAYKSPDADKKITYARQAHECLILEITNAKKEDRDISSVLKMLLPPCSYGNNENRYCDAYYEKKIKDGKMKIEFTCSHHAEWSRTPFCANQEIVGNYERYNDFLNRHFSAVTSGTERPDFRDLILYSGFKIEWMVSPGTELYYDDFSYVFRISAYVNRLPQILPYLKCWYCDSTMDPDFDYTQTSTVYTLTHFKCIHSDTGGNHNKGVYINHCYQCRSMTGRRYIIDQRECKNKAYQLYEGINDSSYICMRCGGSIHFNPRWSIERLVCPKCGVKKGPKRFADGVIKCDRPECGHNGANYGITPQVER